MNLLNPKIPIFFVAFLPQFLPEGAATGRLILLGLVFTAMTAGVFLGCLALAAASRQALLANPSVMAWLRRPFAASFAALGLKLAFERAA